MSRFSSYLRVAVVLGTVSTFVSTSHCWEPDATEYEMALLTQRQSISQIHLEIESDYAVGNGISVTRSKREIWQDGAKRRCNEIREYLDGKGETEVPPYFIVSITTPEYFLYWDGRPLKPPYKKCAYFGLPSDVNYKVYERIRFPFDARQVGIRLGSLFDLYDSPSWNLVVDSPDRIAPATVTTNGDVVQVSFTRAKGATVTQTYERKGNEHVLQSITMVAGKQRGTLQCRHPEHLTGWHGFPEFVEFKMTDGDSIPFHEKSTIRLISVNEPIPRARFSIVTANLRPGTPVIGNAIPKELLKEFHHIQWNGEALVPVSNEEIILRE
jgi:hypothetical protein